MVDAARKEGLLISNNTPGIMTNSATQTGTISPPECLNYPLNGTTSEPTYRRE